MIMKILVVFGSALVGLVVYVTTGTMTGSTQLAILATGACAFSLGVAAARDGFLLVDKSDRTR